MVSEKVKIEPLWKIRLRLSFQSLRRNWALFWESRIGPLGLGIILFFVLLMIAHPILMATVLGSPGLRPHYGV